MTDSVKVDARFAVRMVIGEMILGG
jgi:hypothetical protein